MAVAHGHDVHVHCVAARQFSVISNVKVTTRTMGYFLNPIVYCVSVETSCSKYVERCLSFVATTFLRVWLCFALLVIVLNVEGSYEKIKIGTLGSIS